MTEDNRHLSVRPVDQEHHTVQLAVIEEDDDGLMREVLHIDMTPEAAYVLGRRLSAHAQELMVP